MDRYTHIILPEMLWLLDIEELHILRNKKDHFALGNSLKLYWEIWMSQLENRGQPLVLVFTFHFAWDRFSCSTLHMPDKLSHKHLEIVVTTRHLAAGVLELQACTSTFDFMWNRNSPLHSAGREQVLHHRATYF